LNYPVVGRKGFWTDLLYLFFIDFAIQAIGLYAVATAVEFIVLKLFSSAGIETPLFNLHDALQPFLRFIVFFVVIDFLQWGAHFILHRSNFLWQFHKIHHAQEQLGFASTRSLSFGEYLVLKPAFWIPFALCGFKTADYVIWYVWIAYMLTFLSHCNIRINWGFPEICIHYTGNTLLASFTKYSGKVWGKLRFLIGSLGFTFRFILQPERQRTGC
jgi:sterol desaturase/sphingolipid hydroxylase (fatty acid hydroxylase superfamily)